MKQLIVLVAVVTPMILKIVVTTVLMVSVFSLATAQSYEIEFGVRGGVFNSGTPIEAFSNHYYPPRYSTEKMPYTFGPVVGVLIGDRVEARFEAVRSFFRFSSESTTPFPASGQKSFSTTDGHMWQYPLLVTVHTRSGSVRAFGGGGVSFGRSISGKTAGMTS